MVRPLDTTGCNPVHGEKIAEGERRADALVGNVLLFVWQFFSPPYSGFVHIDDIISVYRQIDISLCEYACVIIRIFIFNVK